MVKLKLNSKLKLNHENMWIVLQFVYYHRFKLSTVTCIGVRLQLRLGYKIQTHDVNLQSVLSLSNIILVLQFSTQNRRSVGVTIIIVHPGIPLHC